MANSATQFLTNTYRQPFKPAKLKGRPDRDKLAANDKAGTYDEFLWELARKFTNSREEAVAAVEEMQNDIRQCAEKEICPVTKKERLTDQIAWLRLKRFLR
ncbi:MAG TPA: hypothetical protein PLL77_01225 [Pyrinomonadaceae bacterium]|nr:hypothetical protein [Pyrinomonadaceae bacterium]